MRKGTAAWRVAEALHQLSWRVFEFAVERGFRRIRHMRLPQHVPSEIQICRLDCGLGCDIVVSPTHVLWDHAFGHEAHRKCGGTLDIDPVVIK